MTESRVFEVIVEYCQYIWFLWMKFTESAPASSRIPLSLSMKARTLQQSTARNRDIFAGANDDATLKRFVRMGDSVLLMPENPKYESIQLSGEDCGGSH